MALAFQEIEINNKLKLDYMIKGDLLLGNTGDTVMLPVGSSGQVLTVNTNASYGVKWDNMLNIIEVSQSFGSNFDYFEDDSTHSITNGSLTTATFSFSARSTGTYRMGWYYEYYVSSTSGNAIVTVLLDGTTVSLNQQVLKGTGTTSDRPISGFIDTTLSSGTHTANMKIQLTGAGRTISIYDQRIEVWKTQ